LQIKQLLLVAKDESHVKQCYSQAAHYFIEFGFYVIGHFNTHLPLTSKYVKALVHAQ